jgi:multidrug resistance efflux pump
MTLFKVSKREINLPKLVVWVGVILIVFHIFSYYLPFTSNAFVVANNVPIAADVSGFITEIYVKNGQRVKKGEVLFKVFQEPYKLAYQEAKARYQEAIEAVKTIEKEIIKTQDVLEEVEIEYQKASLTYQLKSNIDVQRAVAKLEVELLDYDREFYEKKKETLRKQIAVDRQRIKEQQKAVKALKASMENAKVNLDLTLVRAPTDGVVDNMYISKGTPVKIHEPLFSFIDTSTWWVQANFNETDLRRVRPGDKAYVMLRLYYFDKLFEGEVVNQVWVSDRQTTVASSQQQRVQNENEWLLVPQRLPLQIKIKDFDPDYPMHVGLSAYVYIQTY